MSESIQQNHPYAKKKSFFLNRDPVFWRDLSFYFFVYLSQAMISSFTLVYASNLYREAMGYEYLQIRWIILGTYIPYLFKPFLSKRFAHKSKSFLRFIITLGIALNLVGFLIISQESVYSQILFYIPLIFIILAGSVLIDSTADTVIIAKYKEKTSILSWLQQAGATVGSIIVGGIYSATVGNINDWGIFLFFLSFVMLPLLGWLFLRNMFQIGESDVQTNNSAEMNDKHLPKTTAIIESLTSKEKRIFPYFIFLLIGLNASYLVGTLSETIITDRFGEGAFALLNNWFMIGYVVKLVVLVSLAFLLPLIKKYAFSIIIATGVFSIFYLILTPLVSLTSIGILYVIYSPLGLIFGIAWLALMIEIIPKQHTAWWYQIFALIVLLTRIIFEFVGLTLADSLGAAFMFFIAAGLVLVTLPVLIKVMKLKSET